MIIPPLFADHITPHTEGLCAVVWHLLVSHPALAKVGDPLGVARSDARSCRAASRRRRRRRLHRQPLRRPPARRGEPSRSRSTTTSPRAALAPRRRTSTTRGCAIVRGDVDDLEHAGARRWPDTTPSSTWRPTPTSPRPRPTRPSTSTRARCSPTTWSEAMRDGTASSLSSTPRAAASTATSARSRRHEDHGPMLPVSTYGASKLAGEALHLLLRLHVRRSGPVLPLRQRRRAAPDPRRRLRLRPPAARSTRPGCASSATGDKVKSYVHVERRHRSGPDWRGGGRGAIRCVQRRDRRLHHGHRDRRDGRRGGRAAGGAATFEYTGGDRGWKGDVPIVRLNSERIRSLGWKNERSCQEALHDSMEAMLVDARAGRFDA